MIMACSAWIKASRLSGKPRGLRARSFRCVVLSDMSSGLCVDFPLSGSRWLSSCEALISRPARSAQLLLRLIREYEKVS